MARRLTVCQMSCDLQSFRRMMTSLLTSRKLSLRCSMKTNYAVCQALSEPCGSVDSRAVLTQMRYVTMSRPVFLARHTLAGCFDWCGSALSFSLSRSR